MKKLTIKAIFLGILIIKAIFLGIMLVVIFTSCSKNDEFSPFIPSGKYQLSDVTFDVYLNDDFVQSSAGIDISNFVFYDFKPDILIISIEKYGCNGYKVSDTLNYNIQDGMLYCDDFDKDKMNIIKEDTVISYIFKDAFGSGKIDTLITSNLFKLNHTLINNNYKGAASPMYFEKKIYIGVDDYKKEKIHFRKIK